VAQEPPAAPSGQHVLRCRSQPQLERPLGRPGLVAHPLVGHVLRHSSVLGAGDYRRVGVYPQERAVQRLIDFHSYSQLILRPEGWTTTPPPNEAVSRAVADEIRDQIFAVNRVQYTSTPSWDLYFTTGSSTDWTYNQAKIPFSYCIELRDTGTYGFVLPASQIIPTGQENYAAAKFLGSYIAESN